MPIFYYIFSPLLINLALGQLPCLEPPVKANDPIGIEYIGNQSMSDTGSCAMWFNASGNLNYLSSSQFPDTSIRNAKNYCRNPKSPLGVYEPRTWCWLLSNPDTIGYCTIPLCTSICRLTYLGETFRGTTNKTISGQTCQNWNSQSPHPHSFNSTNWPIQGETIDQAGNNCRNPNNSPFGLWCFTTSTTPVWEPCMTPVCKSTFDCVNGLTNFLYKSQTTTEQFLQSCVPWASIPLQYDYQASIPALTSTGNVIPIFHPALLPDASFTDASNFCRNLDNDTSGAWCYVMSGSNYIKKYCKTQCSGVWACLYDRIGSYYQGTVNVTETDQVCANWTMKASLYTDSSFPENSVANAFNYCRNPTNNPGGPWCWLQSNLTRFGFCTIPFCQQSPPLEPLPRNTKNVTCKSTATGVEYTGNISSTTDNNTCASWITVSFYNPYFNRSVLFNTSTVADVLNFCRNPSNDTMGPWCYTMSGVQQNCSVPQCNVSQGTATLKSSAFIQYESRISVPIYCLILAFLSLVGDYFSFNSVFSPRGIK